MSTTIEIWQDYDKGILTFDTLQEAHEFMNNVLIPYREALWQAWQHLPVSKSTSDTWVRVSSSDSRFLAYFR